MLATTAGPRFPVVVRPTRIVLDSCVPRLDNLAAPQASVYAWAAFFLASVRCLAGRLVREFLIQNPQRVEVRYGVVRYLRNGQLLYTSAVPPKYPLRVDAELYDPGVALTDVRVGSSTWTHAVGVTVAGSSLHKTGAAGWTSGAVSANTLEAGDGAMEFTATEIDTTRAAGLSDAGVARPR